MKTALLISTYNNPRYLRFCLLTVLSQTVMPDEILIADDGSGEETKALIDSMRPLFKVPLTHIWHEDNGFRLSAIRNKSIASTSCDYIIQIDGDILLERHFVEDHISIAHEGYWVSGSRVLMTEELTMYVIAKMEAFRQTDTVDIKKIITFSRLGLSKSLNNLRSRLLRKTLKRRYAVKRVDHLRGCNMAYFREDAIRVNGYNESLTSWGHEDGEFAFRLHFSGVRKQSLKMGGVQYHLYHKPASRNNEKAHFSAIEKTKQTKATRCDNGIDKYL